MNFKPASRTQRALTGRERRTRLREGTTPYCPVNVGSNWFWTESGPPRSRVGWQWLFHDVRPPVCVIRRRIRRDFCPKECSDRATPAPIWGYVRGVNIGRSQGVQPNVSPFSATRLALSAPGLVRTVAPVPDHIAPARGGAGFDGNRGNSNPDRPASLSARLPSAAPEVFRPHGCLCLASLLSQELRLSAVLARHSLSNLGKAPKSLGQPGRQAGLTRGHGRCRGCAERTADGCDGRPRRLPTPSPQSRREVVDIPPQRPPLPGRPSVFLEWRVRRPLTLHATLCFRCPR